MTGDWNSSDVQESYSTLLETADNLYDTKHAETIGLVCNNYHLGNGLALATVEKATNISYFWTRGRESFLPSNVQSTNTVDHIFTDKKLDHYLLIQLLMMMHLGALITHQFIQI